MSKAQQIQNDWETNPRWKNVIRPYTAEDVERISGSYNIEYSIARLGAEKLWKQLHEQDWVAGLGALTGNQAVQEVTAGMKAIYLSGWQVAADANNAGEMYPDQSLYPADSVPTVVKKINNALLRRDQIEKTEGNVTRDWLVPIVADAEAGFGGNLNAFELMKAMIEAGASGVHFEDQLSSAKKMRSLRRQSIGAYARSYQQIGSGTLGYGRNERAYTGYCPYGCRSSHINHERY